MQTKRRFIILLTIACILSIILFGFDIDDFHVSSKLFVKMLGRITETSDNVIETSNGNINSITSSSSNTISTIRHITESAKLSTIQPESVTTRINTMLLPLKDITTKVPTTSIPRIGNLTTIPLLQVMTTTRVTYTSDTITNNTKKKLYVTFMGRFGNVVFEFAAAYGMKLATNRSMLFVNNGQANRLTAFFPKLKTEVKRVRRIPPNVEVVRDKAPNKYDKITEIKIANSSNDVHLLGYLGKMKIVNYIPECIRQTRNHANGSKKNIEIHT